MTQLTLNLVDDRESQTDRLRRILAGCPRVQTAAKYFDVDAQREAERIAKEDRNRVR